MFQYLVFSLVSKIQSVESSNIEKMKKKILTFYYYLRIICVGLAKRIALATKALEVLNACPVKDHKEAQEREYS